MLAEIERAITARYTATHASLGIRQSFYRYVGRIKLVDGDQAADRAAEQCIDGNGPFGHSIAAQEAARNYLA